MEHHHPESAPDASRAGASSSEEAASRRAFLIGAGATVAGAALGASSAHAEKVIATEPLVKGSGRLKGKTVVITGAARGIGRALAQAFAAEGADVMGIDIAGPASAISEAEPASRADLDETARLVAAQGRRFIPVVADVRDMNALRDAAKRAEKEFGHVDILIPNAAIQTMKPLLEMNDLEWRDIIDVNLTGYANTIRAFAPMMMQKKTARIIMIASRQGRQGWKNGSSYSASKWGVIGLMKSVSLEMADHGITVNCVEPGLVDTLLTRNPTRLRGAVKETQHTEEAPQNPPVDEVAKMLARQNPMHIPWLQPQDIAPVALFLASDEAYRISGATYDVTAGDSARYTA
ncbi:SDR family NAD(P)-dependent oxidoreductase [Noviherbaspirillum pedocola]|uniref:Mycofactocin-coupled SDR family oxidoreductase n=1 Tax=Noviherbaspirillum pedocola TaxID=2801341 RepID=A0A934W9G3_9BURK|nr:SDR family NAD(P)-dependent oxidoreductase [Noviherbaspirillum pedocola]MBK4738850.1 mycofactocin-coupled SDR family oxidoreductase [Noviherbaspirillum pedocola]